MKSIRRTLLALLLASILITIPATMSQAGKQPTRFPVIVVFNDDEFNDKEVRGKFADRFAADVRLSDEPDVWGYHPLYMVGAVQSFEREYDFKAKNVFSATIRGFAAQLTADQINYLENDPSIAYVEPDSVMTILQQTLPWGINRVDADISSTLAGNGSGSVTNVRIFVIDTGVGTHTDLNRVNHVNFTGDGNNNDCNGHGTHVAGTIAARDNTTAVVGVVPGAPITGVKVLGCNGSGSVSNIVQGIDWVTANAVRPAVANMSLGGGASTALDDAVRRSAAAGIFYALAAGNSAANACNQSPARAGAGTNNGIATVASITSTNQESSFSNFGSCVDIWAPGSSILSTRLGGGTTTLSGTSMASPHVAGSAALFLSSNTSASPATVEANLKNQSVSFGTVSKDGRAIRVVNVRNF
jgi:subtilisin family serine protease